MRQRVAPVEIDLRLLEGAPRPFGVHIDSERPGPVFVVCANVHGDECSGIGAVLRLAERLATELRLGRVHLYPCLNPQGLAARTRGLGVAGPDLNRWFPGDPEGAPVERIAHAWWSEVMRHRPDAVIDLHADSARSVPYVIVDRAVSAAGLRALPAAEQLAEATGLTVIRDYATADYVRFTLERSLAGAVLNHGGVPALTIEAGPRRAVDESTVRLLEESVLRVVEHGLRRPPGPSNSNSGWRRSAGFRAPTDGLLEIAVSAGAVIAPEMRIASLRTLDGRVAAEIASPVHAQVLAWADGPWLTAGSSLGTFAVAEGEEAP